MDATKTYLQISGSFKNIKDEEITEKNLTIQYFDLEKNTWSSLISSLKAIEGKLEASYKIIDLVKSNPVGYAHIKNGLEHNVMPTLRLIDGETEKDAWTVVYSTFPVLHRPDEGLLVVDFGDLWLLETNQINRHIKGKHPEVEFAVGALPRPNGNHAFFPSFQVGLLHTKDLAEYTIGEHDVKLVAKGAEEDLHKIIEELNQELEEKSHELEEKYGEIASLNETIKSLENDEDKDNPDDVLDGELADDGTIIDEKVDAKIVEARPARDVYTTIVDEVKNASEKLEDTPYSLANISLNLKTHVVTDADGFKLQLIDAETAKHTTNESISEVKIDIGTKGNQAQVNTKQSTPSILGLTETAARERLKSFGLKMKVIYQSSQTKTIGQAFKQKPAAGADIDKGDTVITIFAKQTEKFN